MYQEEPKIQAFLDLSGLEIRNYCIGRNLVRLASSQGNSWNSDPCDSLFVALAKKGNVEFPPNEQLHTAELLSSWLGTISQVILMTCPQGSGREEVQAECGMTPTNDSVIRSIKMWRVICAPRAVQLHPVLAAEAICLANSFYKDLKWSFLSPLILRQLAKK